VASREHALSLDAQDKLSHIRDQFSLPSKAQLKAESLQEGKILRARYCLPYLQHQTEKSHSISWFLLKFHLPMWKLTWTPTKASSRAFRATSGYVELSRRVWTFQTSGAVSFAHMARCRCKSFREHGSNRWSTSIRSGRYANTYCQSAFSDERFLQARHNQTSQDYT
jgi:hypothetical protein